ncbi:MAG TPA: YeeE/YedE thiosulfate transporter family protein [Ilumatobacteraceae bacterium]|nr:YeeE/YedE thiosulfate transporter family protein [Ilumatobacteraceae bacterium]
MARTHAIVATIGVAFGFVVSSIGFGDFGQLNAMFTFQTFRMLLAFAGGVVLAAVLQLVLRRPRGNRLRFHKGVVPGAILFGIGWALSAGCPAIPLTQLGGGYLPALVTLAGVAVGMQLFRWANARWLRIDPGRCDI